MLIFLGMEHKQYDDCAKIFLYFGFMVQNSKTLGLGTQMLLGT